VELRFYWAIIWRRIWIVALIVGVVALYVVYEANHLRTTPGALRGNKSEVTLRFGFQSVGSNQNVNDAVTASEALADAFTTGPVLTSTEFMAQIVQQVHSDTDAITQKFGTAPDLGDLQNTDAMSRSLSATHTHNLVTVTVNWGTAAGAWAIANAAGEITTTHLNQYLGYAIASSSPSVQSNGSLPAQAAAQVVSAATDPQATTGTAFNRVILLVVLLLVAFIIGIALAFLMEYLDDRIRSQDEVVQLLQLPSYGTVPRAPTPGGTRSHSAIEA
jgi:capsular polysaccharide biosynthesis protein